MAPAVIVWPLPPPPPPLSPPADPQKGGAKIPTSAISDLWWGGSNISVVLPQIINAHADRHWGLEKSALVSGGLGINYLGGGGGGGDNTCMAPPQPGRITRNVRGGGGGGDNTCMAPPQPGRITRNVRRGGGGTND